MGLQLGGQLVGGLTASNPKLQAIAPTAFGLVSQVGVALPHSRKQESEADHIGLIYMARAGYNPQEAVSFWQRFAAFNQQSGGKSTPAFLSTHPVDSKRIADLQAEMPEAMANYRGGAALAPSTGGVPTPSSSVIGRQQ
jgi:predicted Zn-dependent protease